MAKEVEKPKEQLAPAYFVQYSSLWCVLLGFFVMLLSLGHSQMGPGAEGLGDVRDAFGSSGGLGLLSFAKNVVSGRNEGGSSSFRIRQSSGHSDLGMDGYVRGLMEKQGLSDISSIVVVETESGAKVLIKIPVVFQGDDHLNRDSVRTLEQFAEVLVNLNRSNIEVMSVCSNGGSWKASQYSALIRSAVVARLLSDAASLPVDQIKAVGYSDSRFVDSYGMEPVNECVLIAIQVDRD